MATDVPEAAPETDVAQPVAQGTGFWVKFMAIGGLLMVVMLLQFAMLYFVFGGSSEGAVDPNDPAILDPDNMDDTETTEIEISPQFNCTNSMSHQNQSIHVSFNLVVDVPSHLADQFNEAKKANKNKIRQSVITIIRSAGIEELDDPSLEMISRQIREEINKLLGQSYVMDVIITDYRKMEQ